MSTRRSLMITSRLEGWCLVVYQRSQARRSPTTPGWRPARPYHEIGDWIAAWNDTPKPYVCTKAADQILESIKRNCTRMNDSRH